MLTKRLPDITIADIEKLHGIVESRCIDFKSQAVAGGDRERRDFLADVTAFANASGGEPDPIHLPRIEYYVLRSFPRFVAFLATHNIEPPLYVFISVVRVRNKIAAGTSDDPFDTPTPFR